MGQDEDARRGGGAALEDPLHDPMRVFFPVAPPSKAPHAKVRSKLWYHMVSVSLTCADGLLQHTAV